MLWRDTMPLDVCAHEACPAALLTVAFIVGFALAALLLALPLLLALRLQARAARRHWLTRQLQQLFLLLCRCADDSPKRRQLIEDYAQATADPRRPAAIDESVYATQQHQRIMMLVRFHFPALQGLEQELTAANGRIAALVARLASGETIERAELSHRFHEYGQLLRKMQQEIVNQRERLTRTG